jgi:hypothetical protein
VVLQKKILSIIVFSIFFGCLFTMFDPQFSYIRLAISALLIMWSTQHEIYCVRIIDLLDFPKCRNMLLFKTKSLILYFCIESIDWWGFWYVQEPCNTCLIKSSSVDQTGLTSPIYGQLPHFLSKGTSRVYLFSEKKG